MIRLLTVLSLALAATSPPVINLPQVDLPQPDLPGIGQPAGPLAPATRLAPNFRDAVFGDFLLVGNSVLRCPKPDEDAAGGGSAQDCRAATDFAAPAGGVPASHDNGYVMRLADEDNDPSTFDSSSARLTVPAGATVRYAQLNWGGHTGHVIGFSGVNCARPLLFEGQKPPAPAADGPAAQQVGLSVAGGRTARIPDGDNHFRSVGGLAEPSELYSNWADVTTQLRRAPTGRAVTVSVSNVWAPSGLGCAAGWSLVVVFGYQHNTSAYPQLRAVDVYTDQLPQGGALGALLPGITRPVKGLLPGVLPELLPGLPLFGTDVLLPGVNPRPATANVRLGLTAYDGDWRLPDTLMLDGNPVTEPCSSDSTEDFFRSCADGALDPLDRNRHLANNLAVDAKALRPKLPDNAGGDIELGVQSFADFFLLHNIVLAENVDPGITITNSGPTAPVRQGDIVPFSIQVTNSGSLPLTDVTLTDTSDPASPEIQCLPKALPPLDPGESRRLICTQPADGVPFTNTATVTGTFLTPTGAPPRTVTASASAHVDVTIPAVAIKRVPDRLVAHPGEAVTFHVTVFNNAQTALHDLRYADPATDCGQRSLADLPPRSQVSFTCVTTARETFTSLATLTAADDNGVPIEPVTSQQVTVVVIEPALEISVAADKDTIYHGDTVTLTFTVTNRGRDQAEALTGITVTVPALPGCAPPPVKELAPGQSATTTCTATPAQTVDAVAEATGTDISATAVTARSAPVRITVLDPPLAVTQTADRSTLRTGGTVTLTFTARNTATTGPISNVTITDAAIPDCQPAPIPSLDPGASESRTCTVNLDRSVRSVATAAAVDSAGRAMTTSSPPLPITVINPMLTITTTADPTQARQGAAVRFTVTVRNIGDVALDLEVRNDRAPACDFTVAGEGLPPTAAQGRQCTTHTPAGLDPFTDTAQFTAHTPPTVDDPGGPLTGQASATIQIVPGQAAPDPTPAAGGSGSSSGSGGGGSSAGGGSTGSGSGGSTGSGGGLAYTGAVILLPLIVGGALLGLGLALASATRRRRDGEPSFLDRWWPGN